MIERRYTDEEWQAIVDAVGVSSLTAEIAGHTRGALEKAIAGFLSAETLAREMGERPAREREHWKKIGAKARELAALVAETQYWLSPVWWAGGGLDDHAAKSKAIECLGDLAAIAQSNATDFDLHSREFARQQDPNREKLYVAVFEIWTGHLGRDLTRSPTGPLFRFFKAALDPVLGDDVPASSSMQGIIDREKARRATSAKLDA